jgi:hypothetical protein
MIARLAVLCLAVAACKSPPPRFPVDRNRGIDGAWDVPFEGGMVRLDATGTVVTLDFRGRTFVFHGLTAFRGELGPDQVYLRATEMQIAVTAEYLQVQAFGSLAEGHGETLRWPLADLPSRVVWRDGKLDLAGAATGSRPGGAPLTGRSGRRGRRRAGRPRP